MFPKVISFSDSFFLPTYGLLVAVGFLSALWLSGRLAARVSLNQEHVANVGVYSAIAGLVGAKLLMFVFDFNYYRNHPDEIFSLATLQAGGVFFGGLVIALGAGVCLMRAYKLPPLLTLDVFAPGLALGQAIGRIGCFAAGCCWGVKCDRPWAVQFNDLEANRITGVPLGVHLHPTQLYEAGLLFVAFFILWRMWRKPPAKPGAIMGAYLILAAAERFVVEFFREHQQASYFGSPISNAQMIALGLAALGLALYFRTGQLSEAKIA